MTEQEKQELSKSFEKKYGKRKGFKFLQYRAHRDIFKKDILQPMQREFGEVYKKTKENIKLIDAAIEKKQKKDAKELDRIYSQNSKNVLTLEQVVLKEVHKEHPKMVSEEDIIKWQTKSIPTQ